VDYAGLKRALEAIEEVALYINEQKRNTENQKIMVVLEKKLSSSTKILDFIKAPSRKMKKNSNFKVTVKYDPETKKQDIQESFELYLFNDIIFLLKKRTETETTPVLFFIVYLTFSKIIFDQTMNFLIISTVSKGAKLDYQLIAENPSVDLLENWKTTFNKTIDEVQNLLAKNSEIPIKEFLELQETKMALMIGLPEITKKKNDQDEKQKKAKEEYTQAVKEINEDEAKVRELQKRIQFNKLRIETMESNFLMFERKIKKFTRRISRSFKFKS